MAVLVFIGATSMSKRPHIAGLQLNVFIEYITKSQKESIILKINSKPEYMIVVHGFYPIL